MICFWAQGLASRSWDYQFAAMPVPSPLEGGPSGPGQSGRGCDGQYVYWVVMVQPNPAVIASHRRKRPEAFTRGQFGQLMVKAHAEVDVTIVEAACFLEPHASGLMHHNCLVRADAQYRWKQTAETLFQKYKVSVSFGNDVKTCQQWRSKSRVFAHGVNNDPPICPSHSFCDKFWPG